MSVHHEPDLSYDRSRTAIIAVVGLILAAAVIACLYFFFNPRVEAAPVNTTVAAITTPGADMIGRRVVISGKVASVFNSGAFTVLDANAVAGTPLLVVSKGPIPPVIGRPDQPGLLPGDPVSVAGRVRRFSSTETIDGIKLDLPVYEPYRDSPVLYASAVTPPGNSTVVLTPNAGTRLSDQPIVIGKASTSDRTAEVIAIRRDAAKYYGQRVQIQDALVTEVDSDRGFWIGGLEPERIFVVLDKGLDAGPVEWMVVVKSGKVVTVNGTVKPLPDAATLQAKWKMTPKTAAELAKERVYLHADGIYIRNR
jgi:hypothetical protein